MVRKQLKVLSLTALAVIIIFMTYGAVRSHRTPPNKEKTNLEIKIKKYIKAPEIKATGFIGTDNFSISQNHDKKVVLVYIWSSSCSNCLPVTHHLNQWYQKYSSLGLDVIGVHTPEFEVEKKPDYLNSVAKDMSIEFPIATDNKYQTWKAYANNYWPRIYLLDKDRFIVYDHIGEGAYATTERKIRSLLLETSSRQDTTAQIDTDATVPPFPGTHDLYLGFLRNTTVGNIEPYRPGIQKLTLPKLLKDNNLYLSGDWNFQREYAENQSANAKIILNYSAKEVYFVTGAVVGGAKITISQDGQMSSLQITKDGLYKLISNSTSGQHKLQIGIDKPGLRAYVFRFR